MKTKNKERREMEKKTGIRVKRAGFGVRRNPIIA